MRHTKGAWKILKGNGTHFATINKDSMTRICTIDIGDIGQYNGFAPIEEAEANVKLIAAAPMMLEALEAIAARVNGEYTDPALMKQGALGDMESDLVRYAEAAIELATA